MKLWKKAIVLLLCLVMTFSITGCGKSGGNQGKDAETTKGNSGEGTPAATSAVKEEPKEPVTLEWYYRGNGVQKDSELVEDKLNEMLKSYEGLEHVTVHLNSYPATEYPNAVTLAQSSGKQIDILNTVNLTFSKEVENGTFIPLNDYVNSTLDLKNALPDWLWDLGSIDGNIYIVPNYQRAANMMYLTTPKEYLDKYGDEQKLTQVLQNPSSTPREIAAVLEEYLLAVRKGEGDTKYIRPIGDFYSSEFGFLPYYDNVYDSNMYVKFADEKKVGFLSNLDSMSEIYQISAEQYEKGLVHPDILTLEANITDYEKQNMMNDVSFIFCMTNGAGDSQTVSASYSASYGFDCVSIPLKSEYFVKNVWAAGGNGVTASSKHPEEAMKFIEAMTTEKGKDLYNLVVYGIEGVHYTKVGDDLINTLEYSTSQGGIETSYAAMKWIMGNTFNAYLNQGALANEKEIALEVNNNPNNIISDLIGFTPKKENVETELEQVKAVWTEYHMALSAGVLGTKGWQSYYEEYEKKLTAAGLPTILEDFQKQLDEFYAGK